MDKMARQQLEAAVTSLSGNRRKALSLIIGWCRREQNRENEVNMALRAMAEKQRSPKRQITRYVRAPEKIYFY